MPRRAFALAFAWALVAAPGALAAEAGHGFEFLVHGFYVLDFLVFAGALVWLAKGPAARFLAERHDAVRKEMDEAMSLRREAEDRLHRYESLLRDLEGEVARLVAEFRADGERERDRIRTETEAQAEKLRRETAQSISREARQLETDLEREVAQRALALAEKLLQERMDAEAQKALVKAFIDDLESRSSLASAG